MQEAIEKMNGYGNQGRPFLFIIDFEMKKPLVYPLNEINPSEIEYKIGNYSTISPHQDKNLSFRLKKYPIDFQDYRKAFDIVQENQRKGNSYLTNLTFPTGIDIDISMGEIFAVSKAKYKLLLQDHFVVFSPETFVTIRGGTIQSFPMKGTIDASLPNAQEQLLNGAKEMAEHNTIVDLIRNDLSMVSTNVEVTKFRYVDYLRTSEKDLLQVSSEICGDLPEDYPSRIGDIITTLLPAGSISGAPKKKTVEIICEAEAQERGYYTGIAGIFDGKNLDSFVMIRFIEKSGNRLFYRSGGGITARSEAGKEYNELIDKVYVPVA
ncbi:MAG: aminodeoxychorismate synthase component I [Bacteroidales bacterium]|nr:aminodeoxychorismate synthase component I [Bacteroidales bacterium]